MIGFKDATGKVRQLSAMEFQREFGVEYLPQLIIKKTLPTSFRQKCSQFPDKETHGPNAKLIEQVLAGYVAPSYIAKINERVGHGLFAKNDISEGELIGQYTGVLTTDWSPAKKGSEIDPYLLRYPFQTRYAISAKDGGNETRFANHSTHSANVQRSYLLHEGVLRVLFVAHTPIRRDCQILLDYGTNYWLNSSPVEMRA